MPSLSIFFFVFDGDTTTPLTHFQFTSLHTLLCIHWRINGVFFQTCVHDYGLLYFVCISLYGKLIWTSGKLQGFGFYIGDAEYSSLIKENIALQKCPWTKSLWQTLEDAVAWMLLHDQPLSLDQWLSISKNKIVSEQTTHSTHNREETESRTLPLPLFI